MLIYLLRIDSQFVTNKTITID